MPQMLLPLFPPDATPINDLVGFCKKGDTIYYFNGQMPIFSHHVSDHKSFCLIVSQLVENGVASQAEIVRAFSVSKISIKRYLKRYREGGAKGFFKPRQKRSCTILTTEVLIKVQSLLNDGRSVKSLCKEMNLKPDTVNKAIADGRLHRGLKKSL